MIGTVDRIMFMGSADRVNRRAAITEIVRRVVEGFDPEKVILHGSSSRGEDGPDSDADLLVVMNSVGSKRGLATSIDLALQGIPIPTDITIATTEEVERRRECPGAVIREAINEGIVLYERAA